MAKEPDAGAHDTFRCFTASGRKALTVERSHRALTVIDTDGAKILFSVEGDTAAPTLHLLSDGGREPVRATIAVIEMLIANGPTPRSIHLGKGWDAMAGALLERGIAVNGVADLEVMPEMVWQMPDPWLTRADPLPYPQHFVMTAGTRHPRRRPKPNGVVYSRYIPWLGQTFTFRTVDIAADLARFNRWMNDPRVDYFWQEAGDIDKHRAYLGKIEADPHMLTLFGCMDGEAFCYFEVYWAKENRLGPYYDVENYDRGWHVVVGEDGYRGRHYVATWLPSLMHYLFLDDPRTQRIVGEPRADHAQQIRNLERSGFASIKEFDFPHKRAMLVMLLRERYFGERLWVPRAEAPESEAHRDRSGLNRSIPRLAASGQA
jgi:acetyl CoA:N6-hydroxylysine acetyl transferase